MRAPFPYESNGPLLSKFLVPDPIGRERWEQELKDWNKRPGKESLLQRIIRRDLISEAEYLRVMDQSLGFEIARGELAREVKTSLPESTMLRQFGFILLGVSNGKQRVAGGPELPPVLNKYLGDRAENWQWIMVPPPGPDIKPLGDGRAPLEIQNPRINETESWLTQLLETCQTEGASDLHLESTGSRINARMRVPGGMREIGSWHHSVAGPGIRLLKEWGKIPTSENSLPADGRLQRSTRHGSQVFRISHLRTVNGESMVLRQLSGQKKVRSPKELSVPESLQSEFFKCIQWQPGMALFTGPTGSGKTTTLYAFLSQLSTSSRKILTIEDPIEYELPHAVQSAVDEGNGWTFDRALRSFLRQDPDIIVLGEMRDKTSAEAACRAALTGHCVLATLHSSCESTAMARLAGWGIPRGIIDEVVRLVVNQRLEKTAGSDYSMTAKFTWWRKPTEACGERVPTEGLASGSG